MCLYKNINIIIFCKQLQEDIENYIKIRFDPDAPVRLKQGVLPHIFDCQSKRE